MKYLTLTIIALCAGSLAVSAVISEETKMDENKIQIYQKNPRYWQYKGKPVLLLGGTVEDNLFQITDLKEHLELLASVGGNYIRNTMSSRNRGNVQPFKVVNGKYDLDQWNEEYWNRLQNMLKWTQELDIIPQIEVWAFHDFNQRWWKRNPWNPANNVNYTASDTTLKDHYGNIGRVPHDFFFTVPKLNNDEVVLSYQQKFVDKMLSYTLQYNHVLYCMTNEIHPQFLSEWGWYWSEYIKSKAARAGKKVETTEMFWETNLKAEQQRASLDHPEIYSYFEGSQNSAVEGQKNWDNLQFVYNYIEETPRPINHTKIYGADDGPWEKDTARKAIESFWRNMIGGSASSRFHRPPYGIGLNEKSQAHIRSMRMLTGEMDIFTCEPHNDLLSNRKENGAYATANPGKEYAVYFPNGEPVDLDLSAVQGKMKAKWLDITQSEWAKEETLEAGGTVTLTPPGKGHWAVLINGKIITGANNKPFIKTREVTLGDPSPTDKNWRASITSTMYKKYSIANWDMSKLRIYVDMLKVFGFDSIQLYDNWQRYLNAGWSVWQNSGHWPEKADPGDWPEKMDAMADYARSKGLRTTLFVWGNVAFDYQNNTIPDSINPGDPVDRKALEQYWDRQADHATHFDHIVTHWADPCRCEGDSCTIETAQNLHNEIVRRCRKKNPTIQSTFSLWMLQSERFNEWAGYKDAHTILDSGILPADVMIAVDGNGGRINLSEAKAIAKAGRRAGVWGWYLADNEIRPSLHVRTSAIANAFKKLPAENLIEWYSVDSNNHGLNMQNLYVAGRLMRDPRVDARAALREFIAGAFGTQNVERVEKVFGAIEKTRALWGYKDDCWTKLPAAREAHKLALQISIPDGFKPDFPMVMPPEELAKELVAQTEAIVQFLEFSKAVSELDEMRKQQASQSKIDAAIANLPKVKPPTEWMTNYEYASYLRKLEQLIGNQ